MRALDDEWNRTPMNADEKEIIEILKRSPQTFLSMREISKRLGRGRLFEQDRNWARPILLRMEMDGLLEANPYGEYRLRVDVNDTQSFYQALDRSEASLGETTIFTMDDVAPRSETPVADSDKSS